MSEGDALWRACLEQPDDNTTRKVLADRLQEQGFEALAAALRGFEGRAFVCSAAGIHPEDDLPTRLLGMFSDERDGEARRLIEDNLSLITGHDNFPRQRGRGQQAWRVDDLDFEPFVFDGDGCHVNCSFTLSNDTNGTLATGRAAVRFESDENLLINVHEARFVG